MTGLVSDHALLGYQSLGRPLTTAEQALSQAMLKAFGAGDHDFAVLAARLQEWGVPRPSGDTGPWTLQTLEAELRRINDDLDEAYVKHGIGG